MLPQRNYADWDMHGFLKMFPSNLKQSGLKLANKDLEMVQRWQWKEMMLMHMTEDIPGRSHLGYTFMFQNHSTSKDLNKFL